MSFNEKIRVQIFISQLLNFIYIYIYIYKTIIKVKL